MKAFETITPSNASRSDRTLRNIRDVALGVLLCASGALAWAQPDQKPTKTQPAGPRQEKAAPAQTQTPKSPSAQPESPKSTTAPQENARPANVSQSEPRQMKGLDEEVQEIKSDVLGIGEELRRLEEKLLYPSGTQVAVFVSLAKGDQMRLDAVRLQIDGQLVAHYIYSAKELEALRKGGVQRLYVGNVATGEHQLEVLVDGVTAAGGAFNRTEHFTFRKEVKPRLVGLTLAGPDSANPVALGEW